MMAITLRQGNLSEGTFAYWAEVPEKGTTRRRVASSSTRRDPRTGARLRALQSAPSLGAPVCVAAALPLPGIWAGLLIDWIAGGGEDVGVVFVGLENITLPGTGEVVINAQHWQQPGG